MKWIVYDCILTVVVMLDCRVVRTSSLIKKNWGFNLLPKLFVVTWLPRLCTKIIYSKKKSIDIPHAGKNKVVEVLVRVAYTGTDCLCKMHYSLFYTTTDPNSLRMFTAYTIIIHMASNFSNFFRQKVDYSTPSKLQIRKPCVLTLHLQW
jgi:hypothetical protein